MIRAYSQAQNTEVVHAVEVGSPQNVGVLVESGMGLALVDEFSVRSWSSSHSIVVRPLDQAPVLQANLVHLRYEPLSQITQSFISVLQNLVAQQGLGVSTGTAVMAEA